MSENAIHITRDKELKRGDIVYIEGQIRDIDNSNNWMELNYNNAYFDIALPCSDKVLTHIPGINVITTTHTEAFDRGRKAGVKEGHDEALALFCIINKAPFDIIQYFCANICKLNIERNGTKAGLIDLLSYKDIEAFAEWYAFSVGDILMPKNAGYVPDDIVVVVEVINDNEIKVWSDKYKGCTFITNPYKSYMKLKHKLPSSAEDLNDSINHITDLIKELKEELEKDK